MTQLEEKLRHEVDIIMDSITRLHSLHSQIEKELLPVLAPFETKAYEDMSALSTESVRLAHRLIRVKVSRQKVGGRF